MKLYRNYFSSYVNYIGGVCTGHTSCVGCQEIVFKAMTWHACWQRVSMLTYTYTHAYMHAYVSAHTSYRRACFTCADCVLTCVHACIHAYLHVCTSRLTYMATCSLPSQQPRALSQLAARSPAVRKPIRTYPRPKQAVTPSPVSFAI